MELQNQMFEPCRFEIAQQICHWLKAHAKEPQALQPADALGVYRLMEKPPELKMGDFAFPCFRFAKGFGLKPQEVAAQLAAGLGAAGSRWIDRVEVVNAYVNIFLQKNNLATMLIPKVLSQDYFKTLAQHPERKGVRVMIEYSQPNTHKLFHVGHMRNVALGDAVVRINRYLGYEVVAANYIGDEGAHIAKCLWYIEHTKAKQPQGNKLEWLGEMYAGASIALEDATAEQKLTMERDISAILREIESKQGLRYEYWKVTRQWSLDAFSEIYNWLNVHFDQYFYESEVSEESQTIVSEYLSRGVFQESEGAIGVDLKNEKMGFAMLRKRDGNTLYLTKDLALARRKFDEFKISKSIYVVASEQNLHFKQAFKLLDLMGFKQAKDCFHLSYGMVTLPDGKMSSRKGNVIPFTVLKERLTEELAKPLEKYRGEWSEQELHETNQKLCIGAIKFGMLFSDPVKDIVFDIKDWLSFEGNTGPYLMYSYARSRSILRKAAEQGVKPQALAPISAEAEEEWEIIRFIYDFNDAVEGAAACNKPSILAHHLYSMCRAFNRFHTNVSVLKAETPAKMLARVTLLEAFANTLACGLELLGMTPPERM